MEYSTSAVDEERALFQKFWQDKLQEWFQFQAKCTKEFMTEFFGGRKTQPVKEYARWVLASLCRR